MEEKATFGAGCFWGVEAAFRKVKGVTDTRVGYTGGTTQNPTYEEVCQRHTGHTEAVEVTFDTAVVSYDELLRTLFEIHDPTRQSKTQYRSVIFYHTPAQQAAAEQAVKRLRESGTPIVTDIEPAVTFYPAEEYHQRYYEKHGISGICPG